MLGSNVSATLSTDFEDFVVDFNHAWQEQPLLSSSQKENVFFLGAQTLNTLCHQCHCAFLWTAVEYVQGNGGNYWENIHFNSGKINEKNEKDLCYYLLYSPTSSPNIFKTSIFLNSLHDQYLILMTHVIWMRMKQWHRQKLARKKTFFFFSRSQGSR